MYKSLTIEEIALRDDTDMLGELETITMFYDPIEDEIILNSSHSFYDVCINLVEIYLNKDTNAKAYLKEKMQSLHDEMKILDMVIEIREQKERIRKEVEKQEKHLKELLEKYASFLDKISKVKPGNYCLSYGEMKVLMEKNKGSLWDISYDFFKAGFLKGQRAEKARRKKVQA